MFCRVCGGLLRALGELGRLLWLRCESCGSEQAILADDADECDVEELAYA